MQRIPRASATITEYGAHLEPQLEVDQGESFVIETNDNMHNLVTDADGLAALAEPPLFARQVVRGNPLAGPVAVRGAEPGDALAVTIEAIDVRDWGWTGALPGVGVMDGKTGWEELTGPFATIIRHEPGPSGTLADGEAVMDVGREVRWPLAPFVGTLVAAPERGSENSVVTAGEWGGNLDSRDISAGNTIYLNTAHAGGLLFLGDIHASQGDSELTAIANETAADVTLRCGVVKDKHIPGVCRIDKPDSIVQVDASRRTGSPETAMNACFVNLIEWLVTDYGMGQREAYLHMTANSEVRINVYQFCLGLFCCGVEIPKKYL